MAPQRHQIRPPTFIRALGYDLFARPAGRPPRPPDSFRINSNAMGPNLAGTAHTSRDLGADARAQRWPRVVPLVGCASVSAE